MTRDDLVGVYRQIGEDIVSGDGQVTQGEARLSQIVYTADGYVTVVSTPTGRARVSESSPRVDLNGATSAERAAAANNVVCYGGRFEVKDGSVFHHIEMALNPNAVGSAVQRRVRIDGPDLTLSTEADAQGGFRRIRWRRVEAL
jgi:hypothetical protein